MLYTALFELIIFAGMKIVAISDTHMRHHQITLPEGDMLIHAGDLSSKGSVLEIADFFEWFKSQPHRYKICIAGNHDFLFEQQPSIARSLVPEDITYLENSGTCIEGIFIWGSPIQPEFYNWAFNRERGAEIKQYWDAIPPLTDILITHGPPKGILDATPYGYHAGCEELILSVKKIRPRFHIFGHIHQSYGIEQKSGTTFINASLLNEEYIYANAPVVFETECR